MTPPDPDGFTPELLAAYVDGELDPAARGEVERWLAEHPHALDNVAAQRSFSPTNTGLWEQVEPPEPTASEWAATRRRIEQGLTAGAARPGRAWRAVAVIVACAASIAALIGFGLLTGQRVRTPETPRPNPANFGEVAKAPVVVEPSGPELAPAPREIVAQSRPDDPLAGFAVLPIATDNDVVLERVPDMGVGWLPVGQHPLPGVMVLASPDEFALHRADPSPAWPSGRPRMTTAPGDAPMIFASRSR